VGLIQYFAYSLVPEKQERTEKANEIVCKIDSLRYRIKLQLNPNDDKTLIEMIDKIPDLTHQIDVNIIRAAIDRLVAGSQSLLKNEWEKVKDEAERGDFRRRTRVLSWLWEGKPP
jgi:hypothetical protein